MKELLPWSPLVSSLFVRCSYTPQVLTWGQVAHLLAHSHPLGSLHLESSPLEVGRPCRSVPEHSEHFTDSPSTPESLGGRGGWQGGSRAKVTLRPCVREAPEHSGASSYSRASARTFFPIFPWFTLSPPQVFVQKPFTILPLAF